MQIHIFTKEKDVSFELADIDSNVSFLNLPLREKNRNSR